MFSLGGMGEIFVILVLALIFVGPDKLPEIATKLGKLIRELRRMTGDIKTQLAEQTDMVKPIQEIRSALYDDVVRPLDGVRRELHGVAGSVRRSAPVVRPALPAPGTRVATPSTAKAAAGAPAPGADSEPAIPQLRRRPGASTSSRPDDAGSAASAEPAPGRGSVA